MRCCHHVLRHHVCCNDILFLGQLGSVSVAVPCGRHNDVLAVVVGGGIDGVRRVEIVDVRAPNPNLDGDLKGV